MSLATYPGTRVPVKVTNPDHARHGQAGVTIVPEGSPVDSASVLFDSDNAQETVLLADLSTL